MIQKYRKKPVVIEAMQLTVGRVIDVVMWCGGWSEGDDSVVIPTLEGNMRAQLGDWVIKGVKGEYYPCKPEIFEATYEAVAA